MSTAPADPHPRLTKLIKLYNILAPFISVLIGKFGGTPITLPTLPGGQGADATTTVTAQHLESLTEEEKADLEKQLEAHAHLLDPLTV